MKILDAGHKYLVDGYDGAKPQTIEFMKRIGTNFPGNKGKPHGGTNSQELLRVVIDRCNYLQNQIYHKNNQGIIIRCEESLWLFEDRAAERHNIDQFDFRPDDIIYAKHCLHCGHVVCNGH